LFEGGWDVRTDQERLGCSEVQRTKIYAHFSTVNRRALAARSTGDEVIEEVIIPILIKIP
jgi:site-specific recombinase XerD